MSHSDIKKSCSEDYERFSEYRTLLNEREQKISEGLDKAVLAISSAALGLTYMLSNSLIGKQNLVDVLFLKLSWLALGGSVAVVLVSLSLAGCICLFNRTQCDRILDNRNEIVEHIESKFGDIPDRLEFCESTGLRYITLFFHFLAPICLVIGLVLIGLFVNSNIGNI